MGLEASSCYGENSHDIKSNESCKSASLQNEALVVVHRGSSESIDTPINNNFQVLSELFPLDVDGFYGCNSPFSPNGYTSSKGSISSKDNTIKTGDSTKVQIDRYSPQGRSPKRDSRPLSQTYRNHLSPRTV